MVNYSLIVDFLSSRYGAYEFSFLYGSQAKGTARPDSDVDLIVVFANDGVARRREIVGYGNYTYDVSLLSHAAIKEYLDNAHATHNYRTAFMLECAVLLPSGCAAGEALLQQAHKLLGEMRRPATPDSFRLYFTSLLSDLRNASSTSERVYLTTDAYRSIAEFVLRWHGRRDGRKHAFETIQRLEPKLLAELNDVFTASLHLDESSKFLAFAEQFLVKIGGALKEHSRVGEASLRSH